MGNVMVIPAKRQVGNTARQQDAKPKLESQRIAESVLTAMSRLQATMLRSNITQNLYRKTRNGNLPVFTPMMVFPAPTQKNVRTLTV